MQTYLKTKPAGAQLLLFIGLSLLCFVFISFIAAPLLSQLTGVPLLDLANPDAWKKNTQGVSWFMRGMILAQFLGLFAVPSLLFAKMSNENAFHFLGFKEPYAPLHWLLGILLLLASIPLVDVLGILNQKINFHGPLYDWMKAREQDATQQVQFLTVRHNVKELLLNLFFIAVLAGIGEELFFRGVLQRLFIRMTKSPWAGIVLAGFLFSAFHLQFFGFFPRFLLGTLLGAMYWYSGSIWVSMLAHFFYDALVVTIIYANPQMATDPNATLFKASLIAVPAIISALLVLLLVQQMKKRSKTSYADVYKDDFSSPSPFSF